jgi:1,2-phenylacetyl-CoA epoxidase catalytic subunit
VPEALARVCHEWRCRIAAEYTSAAIAQQVGLWLIQAGAPPDLIDACLAIVADELAHSRLSYAVVVAAGGTGGPALDRDSLGLARRHGALEVDLLHAIARVFCLGETVAVPLFRHLREGCTEPVARAALDRILRDEVRHRDFGWDTLDWLATVIDVTQLDLAPMLAELDASYGAANPAVVADVATTDVERAWGLAPAAEYAEILARTIDRDFRPRFGARGLVLPDKTAP